MHTLFILPMANFILLIRALCIITVALTSLSVRLQAQNTCSQTLIRAQFTYYEGKADEVPAILESCLKDGFSDDEKLQAYRLLTLTYLYLNEPVTASEALLAFLRLNPTYRINEATDPAEFINLYKQFRTWPVYLIGVKAGINTSHVHVLKYYSTDNVYASEAKYNSGISYQLGLSMEIPLTRKLSLSPELYVTSKKFTYNARLFGYEDLSFKETQGRVELPLLVSYTLHKKKLSPYISAGVTSNLILNASGQVIRTDNIQTSEAQQEITGPNITVNEQRKLLNFSATMGAGIKYARKKSIVTLEGRYNLGLTNLAKPSERYTNTELIYKYGYLDNNFTLNSIWIIAGYSIPVYHPKKIVRKKHAAPKENL